MATIPTSEGGLAWHINRTEDDSWMACHADLDDESTLTVFGRSLDGGMSGEWQATRQYKDGSRANMGYCPETPHIRKALRYFAEKVKSVEKTE